MTTRKVLQPSQSQVLGLTTHVEDIKMGCTGSAEVAVPADTSWNKFFDAPGVDLGVREHPVIREREAF